MAVRTAVAFMYWSSLVLSVGAGTANADEVAPDVQEAAAAAGVDAVKLQGAVNSVGTDPWSYLYSAGELARPAPSVPASLQLRVACLEAAESGGANVWNRSGSGAGGVLQYFPGTFARGAREIGHPEYSLWVPAQARIVAAHDLLMGRRGQWSVSGC
jgi:hypothetical protein